MKVVETAVSGGTTRRKAFTLLELLVVVAIIALLVTTITPAFGNLQDMLKRFVCASNMRQMGIAWTAYAQDNRGMICGSNTFNYWDWVRAWSNIKGGALYKHAGRSTEIYKCTNPINPTYAVSYSINGKLNGERPVWKRLNVIPHPAETLMIIEEDDWRGYNVNSFLLTSPNQWTDYVAGNHQKGDNLVFVDTHTEYWRWADPNTLKWPHRDFGFYMRDPGNPDLARLWKVWAGE